MSGEISNITFEVAQDGPAAFLIYRTDETPKRFLGQESTQKEANDFITGYVWGAKGSEAQHDAPPGYYRGHRAGTADTRN